jgi:hypothetical protein
MGFFNNSRPNFFPIPFYLITTQFRNCITLNFLVLGIGYSEFDSNSFSVLRRFLLAFQFGFCFLCPNRNMKNTGKSPSNKGLRSEIERCLYSNFLTRRKGRERGRGRLTRRRHRPRIQAQSKTPHHRQH